MDLSKFFGLGDYILHIDAMEKYLACSEVSDVATRVYRLQSLEAVVFMWICDTVSLQNGTKIKLSSVQKCVSP